MQENSHLISTIADLLHLRGLVAADQHGHLVELLRASTEGHTAIEQSASHTLFIRHSQGISALATLAQAEEQSLALIVDRIQKKPFEGCFTGPETERILSEEQSRAAVKALQRAVFFLEGGPGTGKTYTAAWIIQQSGVRKWLALAPTGKAKAQLEASLLRAGLAPERVMTAQAALSRLTFDGGLLDADLVLVDESSMLDSLLFFRLLKALPLHCRILLLGDRHQLPPVGPGQPFSDFCCRLEGSDWHYRLQASKRVESQELLSIAEAIQEGKAESLPVRPLSAVETVKQQILSFHSRALPLDPAELLQSLAQRMVLGSIQEGPWGVSTMNQQLALETVDIQHPWKPAPIMVLANIEQADLWNGDLGWLCRPDGSAPFVLLPDRRAPYQPGRLPVRQVPLASLPSWDYAWVLTVHKSQGSEFQEVAVVLPPGSETFGRQLLYTAVTRSRKSLVIWSWPQIVQKVVASPSNRRSWLNLSLFKDGWSPPRATG
jgi:exodeoxyribonuclease V alpha subunit